jgi:AcrR family transcriptional regulator
VAAARQDPRANQKARTRAAIVAAAEEHLAVHGTAPTVAEAAAAAGVARATAYRYFPTQEALEVEVVDVTPDVAATEAALEELTTTDVVERVLTLLDAFNPIALEKQEHFRRALRVYLDTWLRSRRVGDETPAVREGRRMRWLDVALGPLEKLPDDTRRRLRAALALTLGGDSMVVMKDVCGLDDEEALDVLRWTAEAILRAAFADADPGAIVVSHPAGDTG